LGRDAYRVFVGRLDGMRPLGRPRPRGDDNIKTNFKKWVGEAWTEFVWLRIGTGGGRF
jgi:hypothetical protein